MTTFRFAAAIGALAAGVAAAGSAGAAPGGVQINSSSVQQSVSSSVVTISGGDSSSSTVSISQSSGSGSISAQAVSSSPPGPRIAVRLPAPRVKALLADREPRLAVSADRAADVDLTVTLRWRAGPRGRVVLLRRELHLEAGAPRGLRLAAGERGLDRLPDTGRITIHVTGRAAAGVAVGLQLTA